MLTNKRAYQFDLKAGSDAQQMVYEMYGLILALHHDARFLRMPGSVDRARIGFVRLLNDYQSPRSRDDATA